jgi:choline monooxygenase
MTVHALRPARPTPVSDDAARSSVLAPRFYTDPAVYALEVARVFHGSWLYAGHESQVAKPGDVLPVKLLDEPLVIVRNREGRLGAFYNVCAHRGMRVVPGPCSTTTLRCPYHGWVYDLDGRLIAARDTRQMPDFDTAALGLPRVALAVVHGMIFVNLAGEDVPIGPSVGAMLDEIPKAGLDPARLRLAKVVDYDLKTNWKIAVENYLECYHCPIAHPGFVDAVIYDQAYARETEDCVFAAAPAKPELAETFRARRDAAGYPHVPLMRYDWAWPNTMVLLGWAAVPHVLLWQILPVGPERTIFRHNFLFYDGVEDPELDELVRGIDALQLEDNGLLEGVFEGMKSKGFRGQGRYIIDDVASYRGERGVHAFQRRVQALYDQAGMGA